MLDYRIYFMDSGGHHIAGVQPVEAHNDREAIAVARLYTGRWPLELWLQGRKVQAFPAGGASSASGGRLGTIADPIG